MKTLTRTILLLFPLFFFQSSFAQSPGRLYNFEEIGWTINLPYEFKMIDSVENERKMNRGKKHIEDANGIIAEISDTKTLISATKNTYNYFNATLTPFNPATDGDFRKVEKTVRDLMYKTIVQRMPDATIDSSTTTILLDGLAFAKFGITVSIKDKFTIHMLLLTKLYRGYDFGISYLYLDEETKSQIEGMLSRSQFAK
ncbi:MAG: hypothetical protein JWQ27_80 [Ferruginibacter sp.]|nr:hypothetical protein [Ferruginibacter sp.]